MNAENESPGATGTSEDDWKRYRDWLYVNRELDFYLDLSRMHLAPDIDRRMASDFERAFAAMDALEAGEIVNPDEDRMVGHYWLRRPELAPDPALAAAIRGDLRGCSVGGPRDEGETR